MSDTKHSLGRVNATRYRPGRQLGHYESFFQRANHPSRPLAFWIRYTIFSPQDHPKTPWANYGPHTSTVRHSSMSP